MIKNNLTKKGQVGVTTTLLNHSNLTDEQIIHERDELNLRLKIRQEIKEARESMKTGELIAFEDMKKELLE